jgi:hypothetical protein
MWASIETRPDKPHKTWLVAELKQPMADYPHFVSAIQRDGMGWDYARQTDIGEVWTFKKPDSFFFFV